MSVKGYFVFVLKENGVDMAPATYDPERGSLVGSRNDVRFILDGKFTAPINAVLDSADEYVVFCTVSFDPTIPPSLYIEKI